MSVAIKKIIRRPDVHRDSYQFSDNYPPLLQKIFASRGALSDQDVSIDLNDLLKPDSLKGLAEGLSLLTDALYQQQTVIVVGDFDADGATSCALAVLSLKAMGLKNIDFLVPNRFEYGYGLTPEIVQVAKQKQPDLIVTVDNGISSISGVDAAKTDGIKVLITDHHLPGKLLPAADAIVNPNQPGCNFPSKNLAGVGVIFYLLSALRTHLKTLGWFKDNAIAEPNMADYLDLVALGTVADVVPLDVNNRILVAQGLRRIRAGRLRPGIKHLLEVSRRSLHRVVSADLAFAIGPRLNAVGRLDDMSLGIQCLITDDDYLARDIASQMNDLNQDRKSIEGEMQAEAFKRLNEISLSESELSFGLCLYERNWHQGVVGILASRIKDKYHRPVIVFAKEDSGDNIKGSARSIPGFHIRDALDVVAVKNPNILKKFGGHAMAAGLSIAEKNLAPFSVAFDQEVRRQLSLEDLQSVLLSDGELDSQHFNISLAYQLRDAVPWGQHFPEPIFDGCFYLINQRLVGKKHLKMVVSIDAKGSQLIDAIAFNIDLSVWPADDVEKVILGYRLDINEYRGNESLQLMVDYCEPLALAN